MSENNQDILNYINRYLLKKQTVSQEHALERQIAELRTSLWKTYQELNDARHDRHRALTSEMLDSLKAEYPFLALQPVGSQLCVYFTDTPVTFHVRNTGDDKDTSVYTTLGAYNFVMEIQSEQLRLYNKTGLSIPWNPSDQLYEVDEEDYGDGLMPYSHPHVYDCDSAHNEPFRSICYGNNNFPELLRRCPLMPENVVEFLSRAAIWFSRVHLEDSYHSLLYRRLQPNPLLARAEARAFAEALFAWANRRLRPALENSGEIPPHTAASLMDEYARFIRDHPSDIALGFSRQAEQLKETNTIQATVQMLSVLQGAYALWLHTAARPQLCRFLSASDLRNALLTDLAYLLFPLSAPSSMMLVDPVRREIWRQKLLNAPRNLKRILGERTTTQEREKYEALIRQLPE